ADRLTPGARLRLLDSVRRPGTLRLDFGAGRGAGSSVRFNGLGRRMAAES
ncbi:MAG: hypothetical protein HZA54_20890, partial [Planctomycetes bacterium]|nr:hypothetical protein [Planctomycetota bacterium]